VRCRSQENRLVIFQLKQAPAGAGIGKDDEKVVRLGLVPISNRPIRRDKGTLVCIRSLNGTITPDIADVAFCAPCLNSSPPWFTGIG